MTHRFTRIAFTDSVKAVQERLGSRATYQRLEARGETPDELGLVETEFIAGRDSFYMATVSETGWPYVQHRGGPSGFLRVLGTRTLGFADFRGNVQYVSLGNVEKNDRVALILMDYANRRRLKILGRLRAVGPAEAHPDLLRRVETADYRARVERIMLIEVEAFDWNCPQHITPRYTEAEVVERIAPLEARIEELERRLREFHGGVYCLINSIKDDTDTVFEAIKQGALGYIDKQTSDLNLERILNYAAADGAIMSPSIARKVFDYFKKPKSFLSELNETEKLITGQILEGNSYKMIASNLNVSIDVVRMHIKRIYKKLRINSKSQLFGLTRKQE